MDQQTFITKRNTWLEEVAIECHQLATNEEMKCDLDFYVFQTSCNIYNPNLLIIGINPGGSKSYKSKLKELGESQRSANSLGYNLSGLEEDINSLTTKPSWEKKGKGADKMRNAFSRVFTQENQLHETLEKAVMMNLVYFNTTKANDLKDIHPHIKKYCIKKTLEFIEILNPKNILFLGAEKDLKKYEITDFNILGNNIKSARFNERLVYIIPHYGYHGAWSYDKGGKMGQSLRSLLIK